MSLYNKDDLWEHATVRRGAASALIRCSSSSSCVLTALHLYSCRRITTLCPLTPTHSELPVHSSELICPHVLITNSHFNSTHWHSADLWSDKERKRKSNIRRKKEQEAKWIGPQFWRLTLVCRSVSPLSLLSIKSFLVIWRNCWFQTETNKSSFLFLVCFIGSLTESLTEVNKC